MNSSREKNGEGVNLVERVVSSPWAFFIFLVIVIGFVTYLVLNMKYKLWSKVSALILLVSPFIPWGLVLPTEGETLLLFPAYFPLTLLWLIAGGLLLVYEWKPKRFRNLSYWLVTVCGLSSIIVWIGFLFLELNIASFIAGSAVRDVERYPLILAPMMASLGLTARGLYMMAQTKRSKLRIKNYLTSDSLRY